MGRHSIGQDFKVRCLLGKERKARPQVGSIGSPSKQYWPFYLSFTGAVPTRWHSCSCENKLSRLFPWCPCLLAGIPAPWRSSQARTFIPEQRLFAGSVMQMYNPTHPLVPLTEHCT